MNTQGISLHGGRSFSGFTLVTKNVTEVVILTSYKIQLTIV